MASVDFTSFLEIGFKCGLGGKGNVGGLGSSESSSSCVWNALFPSLRARNFTAAYVWKSFFMQQVSILLEARWLSLRSHLRNPYWESVGFFLFFSYLLRATPPSWSRPSLTIDKVISKGTPFLICICRCLLKMWPLDGAILSGCSLSPALAAG